MAKTPFTVQRARLGAYSLHAHCDSRELTEPARAAFNRKFLDAVDPDRTLPEAERLRRAECARKAYFVRIGMLSSKARRNKAAQKNRATTPQTGGAA